MFNSFQKFFFFFKMVYDKLTFIFSFIFQKFINKFDIVLFLFIYIFLNNTCFYINLFFEKSFFLDFFFQVVTLTPYYDYDELFSLKLDCAYDKLFQRIVKRFFTIEVLKVFVPSNDFFVALLSCIALFGLFLSIVAILLFWNPISILLNLIFIFLFGALYVITLSFEFLAFMLIILYVGAVVVLFLFCIMFLNLTGLKYYNEYNNYFRNILSFMDEKGFFEFGRQGEIWFFILLFLLIGVLALDVMCSIFLNSLDHNYVAYMDCTKGGELTTFFIFNSIVFSDNPFIKLLGWENIIKLAESNYLSVLAYILYVPILIVLGFMFFIALLALMAVAMDFAYMVFMNKKK